MVYWILLSLESKPTTNSKVIVWNSRVPTSVRESRRNEWMHPPATANACETIVWVCETRRYDSQKPRSHREGQRPHQAGPRLHQEGPRPCQQGPRLHWVFWQKIKFKNFLHWKFCSETSQNHTNAHSIAHSCDIGTVPPKCHQQFCDDVIGIFAMMHTPLFDVSDACLFRVPPSCGHSDDNEPAHFVHHSTMWSTVAWWFCDCVSLIDVFSFAQNLMTK